MNPYEVLGVSPSASVEEVEARYRLLLREYHPDLHQHEGADAIEYCEVMTRTLNSAMTRYRELTGTDRGGRSSRLNGQGHAGASWPPGSGTTDGAGPNGFDGRSRDGGAPTGDRSGSQWAGQNPFYRPPGQGAQDPRDRDATGTGREGNPNAARDWFGDPIEHSPDEPVPCPFCNEAFLRLADYEHHLKRVHNFRAQGPPKREPSRWSLVPLIAWMRYLPAPFIGLLALMFWRFVSFEWFTVWMVVLCLVMWTQTDKRFRNRRK